jgi:hypothetical protein
VRNGKQSNREVIISKIVMIVKQSGKLKRKASGGERARFLGEESEPRNKGIFLAGENHRPDVSACLTVSLSRFWKCFPPGEGEKRSGINRLSGVLFDLCQQFFYVFLVWIQPEGSV